MSTCVIAGESEIDYLVKVFFLRPFLHCKFIITPWLLVTIWGKMHTDSANPILGQLLPANFSIHQ